MILRGDEGGPGPRNESIRAASPGPINIPVLYVTREICCGSSLGMKLQRYDLGVSVDGAYYMRMEQAWRGEECKSHRPYSPDAALT